MTQEFVTLPREVVEQALDALFMYKPMVTGVTFQHGLEAMQALRAAMEQQPNHILDAGNMTLEGWKLVPVEPNDDMDAAAETDYEKFNGGYFPNWKHAYRAMLAAAPQPPYGYDQQALDLCPTCGWKTLIPGDCCLNCARQQPKGEQEPRFFYDEEDALLWTPGEAQYGPEGMTALYTHPQPKREPLTDEKITAATGAKPGTPTWLVDIAFTRAVEAAHNIK